MGTSNGGILPDDSLGHVPAPLAHNEYLSFPSYRQNLLLNVFSPYAHLILLVTLVGVVVIILHLELRLGGWAAAADRQIFGPCDEFARDRDVGDSGETARVLNSAS